MKFRSMEEAPTAYPENLLVLDVSSWRYQRPVLSKKKCSQCGVCFFFCPTGCIVHDGGNLVVNLNFCKGCGICAKVCSRGAITMIREVVE